MTNYKYTGLTAYIIEDNKTIERLHILGDIPYANQTHEHRAYRESFQQTDAYKYIDDNQAFFSPDSCNFPEHTPDSYMLPCIEKVTVDGTDMYRIYAPVVTNNQQHAVNAINAYKQMMTDLFGDSLQNIETTNKISA